LFEEAATEEGTADPGCSIGVVEADSDCIIIIISIL
jgi:hypothetical protein